MIEINYRLYKTKEYIFLTNAPKHCIYFLKKSNFNQKSSINIRIAFKIISKTIHQNKKRADSKMNQPFKYFNSILCTYSNLY
jgi:hypothetical protein